jgi:hypothetical protein
LVERQLPKLNVVGSRPISRSRARVDGSGMSARNAPVGSGRNQVENERSPASQLQPGVDHAVQPLGRQRGGVIRAVQDLLDASGSTGKQLADAIAVAAAPRPGGLWIRADSVQILVVGAWRNLAAGDTGIITPSGCFAGAPPPYAFTILNANFTWEAGP